MLPNPNPAVLVQAVTDGAILLNPEQEIYFGLNTVGAQVWNLLPPVCSDLSEVCSTLANRYPDVDVRSIETDVRELLDALLAEGLVLASTADVA